MRWSAATARENPQGSLVLSECSLLLLVDVFPRHLGELSLQHNDDPEADVRIGKCSLFYNAVNNSMRFIKSHGDVCYVAICSARNPTCPRKFEYRRLRRSAIVCGTTSTTRREAHSPNPLGSALLFALGLVRWFGGELQHGCAQPFLEKGQQVLYGLACALHDEFKCIVVP